MKRFLCLFLSLLLFSMGGCSQTTEEVDKFNIAYYCVINGEKGEIPQEVYVDGANYPLEYTGGNVCIIDGLKTSYNVKEDFINYEIKFDGWFVDEACTLAFEGVDKATTGNIVLYAKLTKNIIHIKRTITYKAVIINEVIDIPSQMFKENGSYPTSYNEGEDIFTIDDLESSCVINGENYSFQGWYSASDCKTAFAGVNKQTCGNMVVYAKINVEVWSPNA